jgi:hypothetical protein
LHDHQRRAPVSPTSRDGDPKESVACPEAASRRSVEGCELLAQRKVLQDQFPMASERQHEGADDDDEELQHAVIVAGVDPNFNSDEFWRTSGGAAVQRVSNAILQGKTYVIDLDLRSYFDTVRHHIVLAKVAQRATTRCCGSARCL